jgi:hypothetical protein
MSDQMNDARVLEILRCWCATSPHNEELCAATEYVAKRLEETDEPMFTASMYGSVEDAEKARIEAQQPAAAVPDMAIGYIDEGEEGGAFVELYPDRAFRIGDKVYLAQALASKAGVPDGWRIVPKEPTQEMKNAGGRYKKHCEETGQQKTVGGYFRAMLAAAPSAPA